MSYLSVYNLIKVALSGRPSGQRVLVPAHESAEIAILDYIEEVKALIGSTTGATGAHGNTTAKTNFDLIWTTPFADTNYDYSVNGFDSSGNPVEIVLISKLSTKLTIKTLIAATVTALAVHY